MLCRVKNSGAFGLDARFEVIEMIAIVQWVSVGIGARMCNMVTGSNQERSFTVRSRKSTPPRIRPRWKTPCWTNLGPNSKTMLAKKDKKLLAKRPYLCKGISVLTLVEHPTFTKNVLKVFEDEEYRELQAELVADPKGGPVIQNLGGLRKKRWAAKGKGKRGGARII